MLAMAISAHTIAAVAVMETKLCWKLNYAADIMQFNILLCNILSGISAIPVGTPSGQVAAV
jgi:hypothetical protein